MAIDNPKQGQDQKNERQEEFDKRSVEILNMKISDSEKLSMLEEARLEILAEQLTVSQSLTESVKELFGIKSKISESEKHTLDLAKQVQNIVKSQSSESQSVEESHKKQNKATNVLNKLKTQSVIVEGDLGKQQLTNVKYAHTRGKHLIEDKARLSDNLKLLAEGATHDRDGNLMSKERLQSQAKSISTEDKKLNTRINNMSTTQKEALYLKQNQDIIKETLANEKKRETQLQKVNNAMGLTGGALSVINKLTGGALGPLEDIEKQSKKELEDLEKKGELHDGLKGKMQGFAITIKNAGKAFVKNLLDPMVLLAAVLENSQSMAKFRQDLGLSYEASIVLRSEMGVIAATSGDIYQTNKKTMESFGTLNAELGFTVDHTGEILETMTNLTGRFGMANNEAARMTGLLRLQGKNTEEISMNIQDSLHGMIQTGDVAFTVKDVFKDIGKTSSSVQVSLGGSVEKIGAAVIQAKKLGLELKDVEGIASSLLEFEQSIEKELTAELLTGRQINLEKARLYALTNDYVNLGKELERQNITFSEYGNMNFKQQEATADMLGMSRDTMSEMLMKQELMGLTNEQIKNQYGESVAEQYKSLGAAEKFGLAMEKIKDTVSNLVVVFTPLIDMIAYMAEHATIALTVLGAIAGLSMASTIANFAVMGIQMGVISVGAITTSSALTLGLGVVGIMAGIGLLMGLFSSAKSTIKSEAMSDGIIGGAQSGFGKRVMLEEGQMPITFSDKDTIFASTKVQKMSDGISNGISEQYNVQKESNNTAINPQSTTPIESESVKPMESTALTVNAPPPPLPPEKVDFSKLENNMKEGFSNMAKLPQGGSQKPQTILNSWDNFASSKSSNLANANERSIVPRPFQFNT